MDNEAKLFEQRMKRELDLYLHPEKRKPKPTASPPVKSGTRVILAVREKRIALDEQFEFFSKSMSRDIAVMEAKKAAKAAGWNIIGYVYSVDKVS